MIFELLKNKIPQLLMEFYILIYSFSGQIQYSDLFYILSTNSSF